MKRDKFIDWDKKKTIDAAIQFERVYWKSFLFSLFKMIERKLRISGVNFLTPIEKQRFFSHWISNQEIQSFFLDSILNSKEIEKISKIEKELYLEEKASGLTEYCRQFSLISISREESISLLKKLMITSGFHYERILVDFLKKHRRESLFILFKEVIDTRPTAKYLLLLEKLIQDGYIKTAQGKISEKLNSEFQLNFS